VVEFAVKRYAHHPEVLSTPKMKQRFDVLILNA
jgi:hypothetical protein